MCSHCVRSDKHVACYCVGAACLRKEWIKQCHTLWVFAGSFQPLFFCNMSKLWKITSTTIICQFSKTAVFLTKNLYKISFQILYDLLHYYIKEQNIKFIFRNTFWKGLSNLESETILCSQWYFQYLKRWKSM